MNELIKLLQKKQSVKYLKDLQNYCQMHETIDISRGQGHLHSIVIDLHFIDLINALGREDSIATTLNFHNQIFQARTLEVLATMLNGNNTITNVINTHGDPLTITNIETQIWAFNKEEERRDITLIGQIEQIPDIPDAPDA